jgi:hypothetical protein
LYVVVVAAALETYGVSWPIVTAVLVRVEVSVRLGLSEFKVLIVIEVDKQRFALLLGIVWEIREVAIHHAWWE